MDGGSMQQGGVSLRRVMEILAKQEKEALKINQDLQRVLQEMRRKESFRAIPGK